MIFGKKRISEDKLANVFVNAVLRLTEQGYPLVVEELRGSPEFVSKPVFGPGDDELFAQIVFAGNLLEAPKHLPPGTDHRLAQHAFSKFAPLMDSSAAELESETSSMQSFMSRINHPSKNTVYAMSRALFHQYDLFGHQTDEYFRDKREPHPVTLKRLNSLMGFFLWDWENFHEHYRIAS